MSNAASHDKMGRLHDKLCDVLLANLEGEEVILFNEDGEPTPVNKVNPALLTVAAKFLKDNAITCQEAEGSKLSELEAKLREKRERRLASVTPLHPDAQALG